MVEATDRLRAFIGMTEAEFLGKPKITSDANSKYLRPSATGNEAGLPRAAFLERSHGNRFQAIYSDQGITVFDTEKENAVIGSYKNFGKGATTLVVAPEYRRQGIGAELMYEWRMLHPTADLGETRTKTAQALQKKVWQRIQGELLSLRAMDYLGEKTMPLSKSMPQY